MSRSISRSKKSRRWTSDTSRNSNMKNSSIRYKISISMRSISISMRSIDRSMNYTISQRSIMNCRSRTNSRRMRRSYTRS